MKEVIIINGPNLNMLGKREKNIYGDLSLQDIKEKCMSLANELEINLEFFQSNSESEIINKIHNCNKEHIIINAAAFTHTSVAIRDALLAVNSNIIEIHLSNIYKREEFRHISYISDIATGVICGFGVNSYLLALRSI